MARAMRDADSSEQLTRQGWMLPARMASRIGQLLMGSAGGPGAGAGGGGETYAQVVAADSPTAWWRLGESSGTTMTDEQGAHHGTYPGSGITLGVAGLISGDSDKAIQFGGSSVAATVANHADFLETNSYTVELWWQPADTANRGLVAKRDGSGGWELRADSGQIAWWLYTGSWYSAKWMTTVSAGSKYHIVAIHDTAAKELRLWVNNVLRDTTSYSPSTPATASDGLSLGLESYAPMGVYDELAYYNNKTLAAARIAAHYNAGVGA